MKESIIAASDMVQLCAFWITRTTLPRPVRRRAVEAGILHEGQPPMFTHEGTLFMHRHAPRSPWSPPAGFKRQEQSVNPASRIALATAILIGAGPYK